MVGLYSKLKLLETAKSARGAASAVASIPSLPAQLAHLTEGTALSGDFIKVAEKMYPVVGLANTVGDGLNVVGGGLSAIGLGKDIYQATKDGKVTFDNAMNIADDTTGVATSIIAAAVPGVGTAIALGLSIGEKAVTMIIRGANAIKQEEKRVGHKLSFNEGAYQVLKANGMEWMTEDIGEAIKNAWHPPPPPKINPYKGMTSMTIAQRKRSGHH
jgi:hypothetical protein